jgi:HK97 family phage major capsid protein
MTTKTAPAATRFSVSAAAKSMLARTYNDRDSFERRCVDILNEQRGIADSGLNHCPVEVLTGTRATPLDVASPSDGGYLTQTKLLADGYIAALQPESSVLQAGANVVDLDRDTTAIPYGNSALTTYWQQDEVTPVAASSMTFGLKTAVRRILYAVVPVSRQLLLTSSVDDYIALEARRALAAQIDLVALQGTGTAGQPTGLLNVAGTGTIAGTSLNYAALVGGMTAVAGNNAFAAPAFITTPTVAGLLKQRPGATSSVPIWDGPVARGAIDSQSAFGTNNMAASTLVHGDFRELLIAQWSDGLQLDIDPFTQFPAAIVSFRFAISVDVQVRTPGAFTIASSIT